MSLQKNHTQEFQTFKDDADAKFLYFSIQPTALNVKQNRANIINYPS